MPDPVSPLDAALEPGDYGLIGPNEAPAVILSAPGEPAMRLASVWGAEGVAAAETALCAATGAKAPAPGRLTTGPRGELARIEPLTWLVLGDAAVAPEPDTGVVVDLSAAMTLIAVEGPRARDALKRLLSIDLREAHFPASSIATTGTLGVTLRLIRRADGPDGAVFHLLAPRSFAAAMWERALTAARPMGCRVV